MTDNATFFFGIITMKVPSLNSRKLNRMDDVTHFCPKSQLMVINCAWKSLSS